MIKRKVDGYCHAFNPKSLGSNNTPFALKKAEGTRSLQNTEGELWVNINDVEGE